MFNKIFGVTLLVACCQALEYNSHQQATSYSQINHNHNSIQHIQSAPVHSYAAPVISYAASAPSHGYSAQSYSSISHAAPATHYSAPLAQVAHYAAPFLSKVAVAPTHHASSYSSLNLGQSGLPAQYATPVAHYAAPVAYAQAPVHYQQEEYAPAKYEFEYGVEDHHTGDIHSHKEAREGDITRGEYSLHEADGTVRTVKYAADKHSGFNAVVERSGHAQHAQPVKAVIAVPHAYHH